MLVVVLLLPVACAFSDKNQIDPDYEQEIFHWRQEREAGLRKPDGWLSLAGLFWLEEGENDFGQDSVLPIHLAAPDIPQTAGTLHLEKGEVSILPSEGSGITIDDEQVVAGMILKTDADPDGPDIFHIGRLMAYVIVRGDRYALRVKDPVKVQGFKGLEFFPIDPDFRVEATLEAYPEAKDISIATAVGIDEKMLCPGILHFKLRGKDVTIQPWIDKPGQQNLFIVFRDETSGKTSYGAGRFLSAILNENGTTILDFNRAFSPPCAFTPFATCPLAPPENTIALAVTAGERLDGGGGH